MATEVRDRPAARPGFRVRPLYVVLVLAAIPILFHLAIDIQRSPLTDFYMTADDLAARPSTGQMARVGGDVVRGSINWDGGSRTLSFDIRGQNTTLRVLYRGFAPETLTDQSTAIVDGKRNSDGTFTANSVIVKCPHKYQAI